MAKYRRVLDGAVNLICTKRRFRTVIHMIATNELKGKDVDSFIQQEKLT